MSKKNAKNDDLPRWRRRFVAGFVRGRRRPETPPEIPRNPQIRAAWVARWAPFGQRRDLGLWMAMVGTGVLTVIVALALAKAEGLAWATLSIGTGIGAISSALAMITMGMTLGPNTAWAVQAFALRSGFEVETASPSLRILSARRPRRFAWSNDLVAIEMGGDGPEDCRAYMPFYLYRRFARLNRPKWDGVTFKS